jgi:hypothetical protein
MRNRALNCDVGPVFIILPAKPLNPAQAITRATGSRLFNLRSGTD